MTDVILQTRDGQFVHRGKVLPYQAWPVVMFWGQRVFFFCGMSRDEPEVPVYAETSCGVVLQ